MITMCAILSGGQNAVDMAIFAQAKQDFLARFLLFFFFNDTATTEIYTLSLHDALPISRSSALSCSPAACACCSSGAARSEEHTSELQSRPHLVCRLLLEKKNDSDIDRRTNHQDSAHKRQVRRCDDS